MITWKKCEHPFGGNCVSYRQKKKKTPNAQSGKEKKFTKEKSHKEKLSKKKITEKKKKKNCQREKKLNHKIKQLQKEN